MLENTTSTTMIHHIKSIFSNLITCHLNLIIIINYSITSSKMSTSRASIEPMMQISLDEPDGCIAEEVSAHETWCAAWRFAAELGNTMGRRAAVMQTREKFQINFSASSTERAFAAKGELPCRPGKNLIIPSHIERKLEDL